MVLDQFAHAASRREWTPSSSLSDVGADTAMKAVVIHSFLLVCSRRNNDGDGAA